MKRIYKYVSALAFTGILAMMMAGNVYAQHGHGGGHGGGGFHGASRGGSFRGSSSFRGSAGGFHGATVNRGAVGARGGVRGAAGFHGAVGVRGRVGAGVGVRSGYGFRGGYGLRSGGFYGGRYYYHGYGSGFRFGLGWGYPHFGLYFGFLPYGYYPFYWNSYPYYYYGGVFYRPYNGGYEVTAPPVGASVPNLPSNAQSIMIDGVQYYEADGVYYQPDVNNNGRTVYVVVGRDGVLNTDNGGGNVNGQPTTDNDEPAMDLPPNNNTQAQNTPQQVQQDNAPVTLKVGDIVDKLPDDCRKVTLNNKKYYVSPDNVFFEDYKDDKGKGYRVASIPPQEGSQGQ